jgi:hypothetical protein
MVYPINLSKNRLCSVDYIVLIDCQFSHSHNFDEETIQKASQAPSGTPKPGDQFEISLQSGNQTGKPRQNIHQK